MRTLPGIVAAMLFTASAASAQIIRAPGGDPPFVIHATIGFVRAETIFDGGTNSAWDFGSGLQYRVSIERSLGSGSSLGLAVSQASMPMAYRRISQLEPAPQGCTAALASSCNATSNVQTIVLSFSAGGSYGFHQILNLGIGAMIFGDFREDATGVALAPASGDTDFLLNLGYGIGFGVSNRVSIAVVQDAGFVMHQRTGLSGDRDSFHQILVTRLGLRLALGN